MQTTLSRRFRKRKTSAASEGWKRSSSNNSAKQCYQQKTRYNAHEISEWSRPMSRVALTSTSSLRFRKVGAPQPWTFSKGLKKVFVVFFLFISL
jgi:hypothetical protein